MRATAATVKGLLFPGLILAPLLGLADEGKVEHLQKQLQQRDQVILELLERVEALEQRVGVPAKSSEPLHTAEAEPETDSAQKASDDAPGRIQVDDAMAERALERSLTRDGAVLLRPGFYELEPSFTYTRVEDATPAVIASGGNLFTGEVERNSNNLSAGLGFRMGLPWDAQLELSIPYRWRDVESVSNIGFTPVGSSSETGSGLGDLKLGLAKTLLREGLWRPDLVGRVTWDTASGEMFDDNVSLGGGFHELSASLTAIKRQDPLAFVGGVAYDYTFEEDQLQPGPIISGNLGSYVALSPETSLRFQFSLGYQAETEFAGNRIEGSDRTLGSLVIGGSTLLAPGTLMNLTASFGLTDDADDFSLSVSIPLRFRK